MNKLTRFFRSRYFLAGLCIALEFAQLMAVFVLLYEFFMPITILGWVFHFGILLYLINRDEIPEFKIPWLIILCVMPVIGAYIFMLLSSNSTSAKEYKRYELAAEKLRPYQQQTAKISELCQDPNALSQANYLYNSGRMPCYGNTKTCYYPTGEGFHAALMDDLRKAERFIFMEYFIVQEGQMWNPIHQILREKAAQGVQVYFLYDDFGCMPTLPERYYRQLRDEGIHCVLANPFTPVLSHIHNNRDHRKITVVDGKVGFTGGINLADEYINAIVKHGHWKDTAVRLEGDAVRNLTALFLVNWNTQGKEQIDPAPYMEVSSGADGGGFVIPFGAGPSPIYKEDIGKNVYLNMINAAKITLYITTPYLICDRELLNALRLAAKRGVDVRLITPHSPDKHTIHMMTRSNYKVLVESGVRIYEYTPGFIHAKNFVCDDKFAVCGTINLDYRSLVHHFECGAWMYRADCIQDMKEDFLRTMERSQEVMIPGASLRGWQRLFAEVMKVFSPLL